VEGMVAAEAEAVMVVVATEAALVAAMVEVAMEEEGTVVAASVAAATVAAVTVVGSGSCSIGGAISAAVLLYYATPLEVVSYVLATVEQQLRQHGRRT
jgi:hypothetical protein